MILKRWLTIKMAYSVIQTEFWHKNRQINGTEQSPETDLHTKSQWTFDQGTKVISIGNSINGAGTTRYLYRKNEPQHLISCNTQKLI